MYKASHLGVVPVSRTLLGRSRPCLLAPITGPSPVRRWEKAGGVEALQVLRDTKADLVAAARNSPSLVVDTEWILIVSMAKGRTTFTACVAH